MLVGMISAVTMNAHADALDELGSRPMTVSERQFVENVISKVEGTFPMPGEAWKRKTQVSIGNDLYHRNTSQGDIYEGYNIVPVPVNIRIDYQQQSVSQAQQTKSAKQHAVNTNDLMKKMMQAASNNDTEAVDRLSQQMAELQSGAYKKHMGDLLSKESRPSRKEKGKEFYVQILVNEGGETIGAKHETSRTKDAYSFLIRRKGQSQHKFYMGSWKVRDTNTGNVSIQPPDAISAMGNHLRVLAVSVNIVGPSVVVDDYVHAHIGLQRLHRIMN